jgi:hypothetical protein
MMQRGKAGAGCGPEEGTEILMCVMQREEKLVCEGQDGGA